MYDWGMNLSPEDREELHHAELLDTIDHMTCDQHGSHAHWRSETLMRLHNKHYGEIKDCKYCGPNHRRHLDQSLEALQSAWLRPSKEPKIGDTTASGVDSYELLPESVKTQLSKMGITPDQVKVVNGILRIKGEK